MTESFENNQTLEAKEEKRQEFLRKAEGWGAIQYALRERLPFGDKDIFAAMAAIIDAQDSAEAEGNEKEFNRLQAEYDKIVKWRMGENEESFEKRITDMRDVKKEGAGDMSENNYPRYQELGGIINEKDYQSALARVKDTAIPDKMPRKQLEQLVKQSEFIAEYSGIKLHNTKNDLDKRIILYIILRTDAKPTEVKYHHSQMGDQRLFAEALRMLEDTNSLQKLIETYPNISFN